MSNNLKDKIGIVEEDGETLIVIDTTSVDKNYINKINKINYPSFKYWELKNIRVENDETGEVIIKPMETIKISKDIPKNLLNEIKQTIIDLVSKENKTIKEAIDEIFNYFKKLKLAKEIEKELIGDLGEAIFILQSFKKGINVMQYIRKRDEELYDYCAKDKYFEIKSSSGEKNEFKLTYEQYKQDINRDIIVVKFKCVANKMNILNIYDEIAKYKILPDVLLEKQNNYRWIQLNYKEQNKNDIIDNYSVILENCHLGLFKNEQLPIVNVEQMNACKKIELSISCTDDELNDINKFYNTIKQTN